MQDILQKKREYEYIILNRDAPPILDKNKVWYLRSKVRY